MKYAVLNEVNPRTLCDDVVCLNTMNARSFLCFFLFLFSFWKIYFIICHEPSVSNPQIPFI